MLRAVGTFHLFTLAGIPVSASPFYFLLLWMFAQGEDALGGVTWGVCITLGLLVHEFGHALVARYLKHQPSIMLHGFGGLTSRQRTGRDVEEALIIAMGPAAGLALGLSVFALWYLAMQLGHGQLLVSRPLFKVVYALLYPCVTWNVLNLLPLWPLDGGQLLRLGVMRLAGARRADKITHSVALALLAFFGVLLLRAGAGAYSWVLIVLLALQNFRALRGQASSGVVYVNHSHAAELVAQAKQALAQQEWKEAARLAHQARSFERIPAPLLDEVWGVLGTSNTALGEHEEALSYLRRARPTASVRQATEACLLALGRQDELAEIQSRWQVNSHGRDLGRWLGTALGFIGVALVIVFTTTLRKFFM
jgi:Zn-dependent protease